MALPLHFYKYQGTGNDFVMIDNRSLFFPKENTALVAFLCDRRMGIGADGLILIENDDETDFKMVYYNADGNESTMCGNGGRCIVAFANKLQMINSNCVFSAVDGIHYANIQKETISLQMIDVKNIDEFEKGAFLNTGSPHHVEIVDAIANVPVFDNGKVIRYHKKYQPGGTNVNFVEILSDGKYKVRTYERGVEDETLSCGTGVTAVAIAMHYIGKTDKQQAEIEVPGGRLNVSFETDGKVYKNVFLTGPAEFVFEGTINIKI